jgi:hypothetical protein
MFMGTKLMHFVPEVHGWRQPLLIIGQIALLSIVWIAFLVWALALTQYLLLAFEHQPGTTWPAEWTRIFYIFCESALLTKAPSVLILFCSVFVFFYRLPRTEDRTTLPLKFSATILTFIVVNIFVVEAITIVPSAWFATIGLNMAEGTVQGFLAVIITVGMLAILFTFQTFGFTRRNYTLRRFDSWQARVVL